MRKNMLKDQHCEELDGLFISALSYAENHDIDWQYALIMGAYHLMEYSNYHSDGDTPQVSALMLFAMKTSLLKRSNEEALKNASDQIQVSIEFDPEVKGKERQAIALIVAAMQAIVEDLYKAQEPKVDTLH